MLTTVIFVHNAEAETGTIPTSRANYFGSALAGVDTRIRLSNDEIHHEMMEVEAPNSRGYLLGSSALKTELERSMQINDVVPVGAAAAEAGNPVQSIILGIAPPENPRTRATKCM